MSLTMTGIGKGVFYLEKSSVQNANGTRRNAGVGFPKYAVFKYESALLERLRLASESGDAEALAALWAEAEPVPGDLDFEFDT